MAFTSILPIQPRSGSLTSAATPIPGNADGAKARLDRNAGDRWSAGQSVYVFVDVSFDTGTTWARVVGSAFDGPLPQFAKDGVSPFQAVVTCAVPTDAQGTRANRFRAGYQVTGAPVTFGVSVDTV
jgi:hypothetical protein